MNAHTIEASPGNRVLVHWCQCGAWGAFGRGVNLRAALDRRDVKLAGDWTCGPDGCRAEAGPVGALPDAGQLELLGGAA